MSSKPEELSPEERLLKVIQTGKSETAPVEKGSDGTKKSDGTKVTDVTDGTPAGKRSDGKPAGKPAGASAPALAKPAGATAGASAPAKAVEPKLKMAVAAPAAPTKADPPDPSERTDQADRSDVKVPPPQPAPERGGRLGLRGVNRLLLAAVVAGILAVAYDLWAYRPEGRGSFESDVALVEKFPQPEALPPYETLTQKMGERNLFNLPAAANKTDAADRANKIAPVAAVAPNFKLMGVSLDERQPGESMAIIRDQVSGNTYFLKTGQRLADSEMTLGEIRAESVMLKTQKGEMELR